jgi:hypothetical protein
VTAGGRTLAKEIRDVASSELAGKDYQSEAINALVRVSHD